MTCTTVGQSTYAVEAMDGGSKPNKTKLDFRFSFIDSNFRIKLKKSQIKVTNVASDITISFFFWQSKCFASCHIHAHTNNLPQFLEEFGHYS